MYKALRTIEGNVRLTRGCAGAKDTIVSVLVLGEPTGWFDGTGSPCNDVTNGFWPAGVHPDTSAGAANVARSDANATAKRPIVYARGRASACLQLCLYVIS